jgi:hypothetical protein
MMTNRFAGAMFVAVLAAGSPVTPFFGACALNLRAQTYGNTRGNAKLAGDCSNDRAAGWIFPELEREFLYADLR